MKDRKVGRVARKKVLEFDEFLKLEGCRTGKHKFFPFKKDLDKDVNMIDLRTDFYQTGQDVIVSIYGKNVVKTDSKITISNSKIDVFLKFKDEKYFKKEIILFGNVDPTKSSFEIMSTKTEIVLRKLQGDNWPKLAK